jgi:integrase
MHHMMAKASTIWSKDTGLQRNPAGEVEVRRPDDARERYLSEGELARLKRALDDNRYRRGTKDLNQTILRMRLIVLIALTTGMRVSEIFGLRWSDVMYGEGLLAVRAKLKGGKMRYVPMLPEVASELERYPVMISDDRVFPPRKGARGVRRRLEGSFEDLLKRAKISNFRFHDLRHTFASWFMMSGGNLYELARILGHSNIKMTERYAKLGKEHIARTSSTAREMWKLLEANAMFANGSRGVNDGISGHC